MKTTQQKKITAYLLSFLFSNLLLTACGTGGAPIPLLNVVTQLNTNTELPMASAIKQNGTAIIQQRISTYTAHSLTTKIGANTQPNIHINNIRLEPNISGLNAKFSIDKNDPGLNDEALIKAEINYQDHHTIIDKNLHMIIEVEDTNDLDIPYNVNLIAQDDRNHSQLLAHICVDEVLISSNGELHIHFVNNSRELVNRIILNIASAPESKWFLDTLKEDSRAQLNGHNQIIYDDKNLGAGEDVYEISLKIDTNKLKKHLKQKENRQQLIDNINTGSLLNLDASNIEVTNISLSTDF